MKLLISTLLVFSLYAAALGQIQLEVIYPKPDQQLPEIDSTFIFGNVSPEATLRIDGFPVPVHEGGGWLAYLPVSRGRFIFRLTALLETDSVTMEVPVQVGNSTNTGLPVRPLIPSAILPDEQMVYSVGDVFEFVFEAPPGGIGWFRIGSSDSTVMLEAPPEEPVYWGDVFGTSSYDQQVNSDYVKYVGHCRLAPSDTGSHNIYYRYRYPMNAAPISSPLRKEWLNTDEILTVVTEFPPKVGMLSGTSQIIRTGPQMGYKLLYQPPGIKVRVRGSRDGFYRLALADGVTGYVNIDSLTLLPPGTPIPKGRVSFISLDAQGRNIVLSANVGQMLPFEIRERENPPGLDIDLYGVTGDVDWIRYNNVGDFHGIVKWSQPSDGIFRITVRLDKGSIAGYKPYYDGNRFVLEIKKKKVSRSRFRSPFRGIKVAIDPGHSHDSGATGPTGLQEQDANLWIAHELRLMLLDAGAEVMMTRYGHEDIRLYDRPKMAEKWGADILISIHNNALPDGINPFENNGSSVYYYHPHSKALAEAIHKHLIEATDLPDHGLYYGNLVLTRPTEMPAVLVECAFMMLPEQEALLKTDKFQRKCAKAILKGIKDYLRE